MFRNATINGNNSPSLLRLLFCLSVSVFPFESCLYFSVSLNFFHIYTLNHISLSSSPISFYSFIPLFPFLSFCRAAVLCLHLTLIFSFSHSIVFLSVLLYLYYSSILLVISFSLLILTFSVLLYLKGSIIVLAEIFTRRVFKSIQASSNRGKNSRLADILEYPLKPLIYSPCQIFSACHYFSQFSPARKETA